MQLLQAGLTARETLQTLGVMQFGAAARGTVGSRMKQLSHVPVQARGSLLWSGVDCMYTRKCIQ